MIERSKRTATSRQTTAKRQRRDASILSAVSETLEQRWLMANISGAVFNDINGDGTLGAAPEGGVAGWTVFRDLNSNGLFDVSNATAYSNNVSTPIADPVNTNDPPATTTSSIVVPAGSGAPLYDVNVVVNITHPYDQDLTLTLISPTNVRILLVDRAGVDGDNYSITTFDDEATYSIAEGTPPYNGSFRPVGALSGLDGINPAGTWKLEAVDNEAVDKGTINSWSVQITTSEPFTKTSASGAYSFTGLSSGTYQLGVALQAGYQFTQPVNGVRSVVLGSTDSTNQNFGVRLPPGQVTGVKWSDLDSDGVRDAGEPGLANVRIYADLNTNGQYDSATEPSTLTDANGNYTLASLPVGNYVIGEVVPINSTQTYPGVFGALTAPGAKSGAVASQVSTIKTSSPTVTKTPTASSTTTRKTTTSPKPSRSSVNPVISVFAPGTKPAVVNAALKTSTTNAAAAKGGGGAAAFSFPDSNRWTSTVRSGSGLTHGDATIITWSIVPDGTSISGGTGEAAAPSNLQSVFTGIYGPMMTTWQPMIQAALNTWSRYTGVTYVYEGADDGAAITGNQGQNPGAAGKRGDVRIGGHTIDGFNAQTGSGVLAYDYFPDVADMVIDTGDSFFATNKNNPVALRNVIAHEDGHGLGLNHVYPTNGTKLMEPFLNLGFDGPQPDDILAANRGYGDPLEQGLNGSGPNDTAAAASDLGTLATGTYDARTIMDGIYLATGDPGVGALSIDDVSDKDYFKFSVASGQRVSLTLDPVGTTYLSGSSAGATALFDAKSQSDLTLQLIGSDGTAVLASANLNGAGASELISNYVTAAGGTFYARISGSASAAQMYSLALNVGASQPGTWSVTVGPGQTVANVNFGNHLNGGVTSRLLFYNNSKFDGGDPAANSLDDGAIATDKTALLPGTGPATFANYSSYVSGINGIMIDLAGIPANQTPTLDDFTIQMGADTASEPPPWAAAPTPTFTFRRGAGANGTDRVELTWLDPAAVKGQWVRVTTMATARTGLTTQDVFYFGNLPGETGNTTAPTAVVDADDFYGTRNNVRAYETPAPITWNWDFNRDGVTDLTDMLLVRSNATTTTGLKMISPAAQVSPIVAQTTGSSKTTTAATTTKPVTVSVPASTSRFATISTAGGLLRVSPTLRTTLTATPLLLSIGTRQRTVAAALVRSY